MLAHPVVTKARNRSSNGSARGFRHKLHRIFKTERELLLFDDEASTGVVKWESQDHIEIEFKRLELSDIESILVQKELELVTFQGEVYAFELKYLRIVGIYFAELDEIRAKIAEVRAQLNSGDEKLQEEAERARTQARESAEASEAASFARHSISAPFKPSVAIKKLFRNIAKRIHPDLARDEADSLRRHRFMAEANKAYRAEDALRLQALIREWEESLKSVSEDGRTELRQIIKKIFQAKERLRIIHETIKQLQSSDIGKLKKRAEAEEKKGGDLFSKLTQHLQDDIIQERARLSEMLQRNSYR
jgi:hypothetical protein